MRVRCCRQLGTPRWNKEVIPLRSRNVSTSTLVQDCNRREQEERKWLVFFEDPSQWWDNRSKNWKNDPDFKHATTGESLWIQSLHCPRWVPARLKCLRDVSTGLKKLRAAFRAGEASDTSSLVYELKQCSNSKDLHRAKELHLKATSTGLHLNIYVANSLINLYVKCGSLEDAKMIFDNMIRRDVVSWNSLLHGYAVKSPETSLQMFLKMESDGCQPDARTFMSVFMACASLATVEEGTEVTGVSSDTVKLNSLEQGMSLHAGCVRSCSQWDIFLSNTLIDMYCKCRSMLDARTVFDRMKEHSVVSWTSLMLGYVENGQAELALELFDSLTLEPDCRTLVVVLMACSSLVERDEAGKTLWLEKIRSVHLQTAKLSMEPDMFIANTLIDAYAKCGSLVDSRQVFDSMSQRDVVSWTTLMLCCAENGDSEAVFELFSRMQQTEDLLPDARTYLAVTMACSDKAVHEQGKDVAGRVVKLQSLEKGMNVHSKALQSGYEDDLFLATSLVDMYAKCGSLLDARTVFDKMLSRSQDFVAVPWNSLLAGYASAGEGKLALELFEFVPVRTARTYAAALAASGSITALETGRCRLHAEVYRRGLEYDGYVSSCLIDFYAKCGCMLEAKRLFDSLITSKSLVSWSALITGYSSQGSHKDVLVSFRAMCEEGVSPDGVTFLSVLMSCSHAGLLDEGKRYFDSMSPQYGVSPSIEHYHCMIDMLGRCNRLDEALSLVERMPFEASAVTWTSLLAACHKWKNIAMAKTAYEALVKLNAEQASSYVLLGNTYKLTSE